MSNWSVDKIIGTGLIIALILSIIAGTWTGGGVELQTTIASGLLGFLGRIAMSDGQRQNQAPAQSQTSDALGKIAETASEAQKVVDAMESIKDIVKK